MSNLCSKCHEKEVLIDEDLLICDKCETEWADSLYKQGYNDAMGEAMPIIKPIAEAPKDGRMILGYSPDNDYEYPFIITYTRYTEECDDDWTLIDEQQRIFWQEEPLSFTHFIEIPQSIGEDNA